MVDRRVAARVAAPVLVAAVVLAGCARPAATSPADQPDATDDATDDVGTDGASTATASSVPDEVGAGLASAGMHTEGLLRGVPTTCRLVEDGDARAIEAREAITAELDAPDEFGPMVVVAAADEAMMAVSRYGAEGPSDPAIWVVAADGTVRAVAGTAAQATSFDLVTVDTAGEGLRPRALAEASDCSWIATDAADTRPEPPVPSPELRPDLVTAAPDPVGPGAVVALSFPTATMRGVAFQLDRRTEDGWEPVSWMTSDANGGEPITVPAFTNGYGTDAVGIEGPGPDHVVLPDDLAAGEYRICTANRGDPEICAELEVS